MKNKANNQRNNLKLTWLKLTAHRSTNWVNTAGKQTTQQVESGAK